ncbi:MAG TPA: homocysteine S-methyltransferase [Gemmatimonadales bacterium]
MTANPLQPFLRAAGVVLLDGGLATELERRGADLHGHLWSARLLVDQPDLLRQVHLGYFTAGADVAITASYQASIGGLLQRGVSEPEGRAAIRRSVQMAAEAREQFLEPGLPPGRRPPLVAGSIGPFGAARADGSEYSGHYGVSRQALADFHGPRLEELIRAGADLLAIETIPSPEEAEVVVQLLRAWPAVGAWVSFSCRDAAHVCEGEPIEAAVAPIVGHPQVLAVGVNCTPPEFIEPLLHRLRRVTDKPLVAYPNSGEAWDATRRCWVGAGGFDPAVEGPRWYAAGARLIGGCCRTTPETIRSLRAALAPPVAERLQ